MASFSEALQNAVRNTICGYLANQSALEYAFSGLLGSPYNPGGIPGTAAWWRPVLCNSPPPAPIPPPFFGGQCAVDYQVSFSYYSSSIPPSPPFDDRGTGTVVLRGPIRGFQAFQQNDQKGFVCVGTNADGSPQFGGGRLVSDPPFRVYEFAITGVQRIDGQSDNCGDPPVPDPDPLPEGGNVTNVNITYNDFNGNTVNISPTLIVGKAFIDVNLNINIPVTVNLSANAELTVNVNLSTGNISINPPGNRGGNNRGDQQPDDGELDPDPPTDEEEASRRIVGVCVNVIQVNNSRPTIIGQTLNPDIYAPNIGYISFKISIPGINATWWTSEIPVKNLKQFIPCPWEYGAIDVTGTPIQGTVWQLIPVYDSLEQPLPVE